MTDVITAATTMPTVIATAPARLSIQRLPAADAADTMDVIANNRILKPKQAVQLSLCTACFYIDLSCVTCYTFVPENKKYNQKFWEINLAKFR